MLRTLLRLALGARLPITRGTLQIPALRAPVRIHRDANGVPCIEATCDDDAFYALGFCQGQDRAFQIELFLRVSHGRLAEVTGAEMLAVDQLARRVGFARIARAQFACLDEATRARFAHFARGVNDGVRLGLPKRPHEMTLLGTAPLAFEPADTLAVLQFFAFALSSNWDAELARLRILRADGLGALIDLEAAHPDWLRDDSADGAGAPWLTSDAEALGAAERLATAAATLAHVTGAGGASNNWVLAPSRTATGRPLLACDPHLSPTVPSPWYLVHVRTPEWAFTGACIPSQPVVSFGHNERVAWGLTAGHIDNTDLFLEKLGADGRSVLQGDAYVPCEVHEEVIRVKGGADVMERVLVTPRGPIVSPALAGDTGALSLRGTWMAARPIRAYDSFRARSADEARALFASYPAPSENRLFADVDGNIAWQMTGDTPVRRRGHGMLPMAGWDPANGWEEHVLPYAELPGCANPAEGFLASANNAPARRAGSAFLGADWLDGHRYARVVEALAARDDWDVASAMALQLDRTSLVWRTVRARVLAAVAGEGTGVDAAQGRALLEGWDGVVGAESAGAAVFELFFAEMMRRAMAAKAPRAWRAALGLGTNAVLTHGMMSLRRVSQLERWLCDHPEGWFARGWEREMVDALAAAVQKLRARAGDDPARWAWGRVRTLTLEHPVGAQPPLGRVFNIGPLACGGDATTIPQASVDFANPTGNPIGVPNLRLAIDVGNWEASRWILAGGQSGNPLSPHYADMVPRWERGEGVAIPWSPESVLRAARTTLTLEPA